MSVARLNLSIVKRYRMDARLKSNMAEFLLAIFLYGITSVVIAADPINEAIYELELFEGFNGNCLLVDCASDFNKRIQPVREAYFVYGDPPLSDLRENAPWAFAFANANGRVISSLDRVGVNFSALKARGQKDYLYEHYLEWKGTFKWKGEGSKTTATIMPSFLELGGARPTDISPDDLPRPYIRVHFWIEVYNLSRWHIGSWEEPAAYIEYSMSGYPGSDGWPQPSNLGNRRLDQIDFREDNYIYGVNEAELEVTKSIDGTTARIDIHKNKIDLAYLDRLKLEPGEEYVVEYQVSVEGVTNNGEGFISRAYFRDPLDTTGSGENGGIVFETEDEPLSEDTEPLVKRIKSSCTEDFNDERYVINGDATVTDRYTGLMWQRCSQGYTLNNNATLENIQDDKCELNSEKTSRDWQTALADAQTDSFAGFDDWRLPDIKELDTLVVNCLTPSIEPYAFPDTPIHPFWSNTPVAGVQQLAYAWQIDFLKGDVDREDGSTAAYTRLVRTSSEVPIIPLPRLSGSYKKIIEGDPGQSTTIMLPLTLHKPALGDVTVDYQILFSSATDGGVDYDTLPFETIRIPESETQVEIPITIHGDAEYEGFEEIRLDLINVSDNARLDLPIILVKIIDDEPVIRMPRAMVQADEGNNGENRDIKIPITLSKPAIDTIEVDYTAINDSAELGTDYINGTGTVRFDPGQIEQTITIQTVGNNTENREKTFFLQLSNPVGADFGLGNTSSIARKVMIVDDDGADHLYGLNDTGITQCGTDIDAALLSCPQINFPGQDAEYGFDVSDTDDTDGLNGLSYTKLDSTGALLSSAAQHSTEPWDCVRDNNTGLYWEVKADANDSGNLRKANAQFSWFNSTTINSGGAAGTENGGNCADGANCDTEKYVAQVNLLNLCGFNDWRLPTLDELLTISNYGQTLDVNFFPNQEIGESRFVDGTWSSTPYFDPSGGTQYVWMLNDLGMNITNKSQIDNGFYAIPYSQRYIRLVRGGLPRYIR